MKTRTSFGFIVLGTAEVEGLYRPPSPGEQVQIDEYRDRYKKAMGVGDPHGLHFFPLDGELTAVWLPQEE
jgi:hypothetical protein